MKRSHGAKSAFAFDRDGAGMLDLLSVARRYHNDVERRSPEGFGIQRPRDRRKTLRRVVCAGGHRKRCPRHDPHQSCRARHDRRGSLVRAQRRLALHRQRNGDVAARKARARRRRFRSRRPRSERTHCLPKRIAAKAVDRPCHPLAQPERLRRTPDPGDLAHETPLGPPIRRVVHRSRSFQRHQRYLRTRRGRPLTRSYRASSRTLRADRRRRRPARRRRVRHSSDGDRGFEGRERCCRSDQRRDAHSHNDWDAVGQRHRQHWNRAGQPPLRTLRHVCGRARSIAFDR